jgi:glucosamine--fructose-6-phosphate aminotransferase (isomerizing)
LKHWPLALVDENYPTVLFTPNDLLFEKNVSSIQEIKARKWIVVTVSDKDIVNSDYNIKIWSTIDEMYPFVTAVVWQLLSYYTADLLGREIDKPRNLAKSVTVK